MFLQLLERQACSLQPSRPNHFRLSVSSSLPATFSHGCFENISLKSMLLLKIWTGVKILQSLSGNLIFRTTCWVLSHIMKKFIESEECFCLNIRNVRFQKKVLKMLQIFWVSILRGPFSVSFAHSLHGKICQGKMRFSRRVNKPTKLLMFDNERSYIVTEWQRRVGVSFDPAAMWIPLHVQIQIPVQGDDALCV